ncbi:MAG: phosphotransferase family protein [Candidatus Woesearchaeota archaeon]
MITEQEISQIIHRLFPQAKIKQITPLQGWMNVAYKIDFFSEELNSVIIKPSRRKPARNVAKEEHVYEILHKHQLAAPHVYHLDTTRKYLDCDVLVIECLPGIKANDTWNTLNKKQKQRLIKNMAKYLAKMHTKCTFRQAGKFYANKTAYQGTFKEMHLTNIQEGAEELRKQKVVDEQLIQEAINTTKQYAHLIENIQPYCLTHMDFTLENIFVDKNQNVTGVIDWEHAEIGINLWEFFQLQRWVFSKEKWIEEEFIAEYKKHAHIPNNWKEIVTYLRIQLDLKFVYRLINTQQEKLAKEYIQKVREHIKKTNQITSRSKA